MKRIHLALASALFLLACSREIPSDTLTQILYEMYLTDAVLNRRSFSSGDSVRVYEPIAGKYGYTLDEVKKTLVKYAAAEGKTQELFSRIDNRIKEEKSKYAEAARIEKLASNFYSGQDSISVRSRTFNRQNISVALEEAGIYDISAQFLFMKNDSTPNPRMTVWLESYEHKDSAVGRAETALSKDTVFAEYSLRINFDNPKFNQLRGHFLTFDDPPAKKERPAAPPALPNPGRKPGDRKKQPLPKPKEDPFRQIYIMKAMSIKYNFAASDSLKAQKNKMQDSIRNASPDSVKYTEMQFVN
ncbi:MAG: DUF4296 domain-containing protein [Prevotellaceae bacterium]|jgi:hypothetical protein|nr:DUF4296 domain-containing protein [Prevotellaceae bacterium]